MASNRLAFLCCIALCVGLIKPNSDGFAADISAPCNARRNTGLEIIAKRDPGFQQSCFRVGMELLESATGQDENLVEAEGIFETLIKLTPESAYPLVGYVELAIRKHELHLRSKAVNLIYQDAKRAVALKPAIPEAYVTLARAELLVGCLPCAEKSVIMAREAGASGVEFAVLQSMVAELRGNAGEAKRTLSEILAEPNLKPQTRARLHLALAAHFVRSKRLDNAESEFERATVATPQSVTPFVRRAEFLMYVRGDARRAKAAADQANALNITWAAKRVASLSDYMIWSQDYLAGRPWDRINRIAQTSFVPPEEALILGARHIPLSGICESLLRAGVVREVDIRDGEGNTALIAAGRAGNVKIARHLLARRANINAQNNMADRALSLALRGGARELAMVLLSAGAEIDFMNNHGNTPLALAVQQRDTAMVIELLRRKAKIPSRGPWMGGDLLSAAILNDDIGTLRALLDGGVKVDALDKNDRTALVTAVTSNNKGAIQLLLARGANPDLVLDIARSMGIPDVLKLITAAKRQAI